MSELLRALASMAEPPGPHTAVIADALALPDAPTSDDFTRLFAFQLYPYASVYLGPEGMLGGEARDRVAGFFRAVGVNPPTEPDHASTLLGAFADVAEATPEDGPPWQIRTALLDEHLLSWMPVWLTRVDDLGDATHRRWAELLLEALGAEAAAVVANSDRTGGETAALPLHLRSAPGLPDPREEGAEAFLAGLLAPVRTGFVITVTDLLDAARETSLGGRIAERRYVLTNLFDQDPVAVLRWLPEFIRTQAARRAELAPWWAGTGTGSWWQRRAAETAQILEEVAAAAVMADATPSRGNR